MNIVGSAKHAAALDIDSRLYVEGELITGVARLDLPAALEKDIIELRVALRGEMHTWVRVSNGQSTVVYRSRDNMIDDGRVLWTHSEDDSAKGGQLTFPFSFTVGNSERRLPPSFDCGHSWQGGRVQYFIHLVAVRKSWYQRNVRINSAFPFLPADHSTAAQTDFAEWKGPWSTHSESFKVRSNVFQFFAAAAFVDVQLKLPEADALPICRPIPAQLDITCRSKPLPASSSDDPSKFQFPRLPNSADVTLELVRIATVRAGGRKRVVTTSLQAFPVHVAKEINETSKPLWLPEYDEPDKGRWTENMSYATTLFLRCPPSFETKHIISKLFLELKLRLPGLGNDVKLTVGPLNVTSGTFGASAPSATVLDLPPYYWDVVDPDEKGADDKKEKD